MFHRLRHRIDGRTAACRDRGDAGFTIVESIVSLVIFTVLSAAATTAVMAGVNASHTSHVLVTESAIARSDLDQARVMDQPASTTYTTTPAGSANQFTVTRTVNPSYPTTCAVGSLITIKVTVSWNSHSVTMTTARAC